MSFSILAVTVGHTIDYTVFYRPVSKDIHSISVYFPDAVREILVKRNTACSNKHLMPFDRVFTGIWVMSLVLSTALLSNKS